MIDVAGSVGAEDEAWRWGLAMVEIFVMREEGECETLRCGLAW